MVPPRLSLAMPTLPPVSPTPVPPPTLGTSGTPWQSVVLVAMAALLLGAGASLAARPGSVARILASAAALRAVRAGRAPGATQPVAVVGPQELVPLAVADDPRPPQGRGTSVIEIGARRERRRILPPT
jgi:hypothetical protein